LSWESSQVPKIAAISTQLAGFRPPADGAEPPDPDPPDPPGPANPDPPSPANPDPADPYRKAVLDGHLALLIALTAAGATLGKAYNLGRALADPPRPNQELEELQESFAPYRLAQLRHDLDDLASVLPGHAAKAVGQSLTWWRDAVFMA